MQLNDKIINFEKKKENNISEKTNKKANRIHLELLSFIQNEILNKQNLNSSFSFSSKPQNLDTKLSINNCIIIDEEKLKDIYYSDDESGEQEDNSSDMSVEEEILI